MTARVPYTRPAPPNRVEITHLLHLSGWSRRGLAEAVHVAESTVDQWLAAPGTARSGTRMPPGLYELAVRKIADMRVVK